MTRYPFNVNMTVEYNTIKLNLGKVIEYLKPFLPIANCHMVDYFTKNLLDTYLKPVLGEEILQVDFKDALNSILNFEIELEKQARFNSFISNCERFRLYNCKDVCVSLDNFKQTLHDFGATCKSSFKIDIFMNEKKAHEVEISSSIAATIADFTKASHIIDIGDGKGYLSSMLAFRYDLPVLGVDAQLTNTLGASKRAQKLGKQWSGTTTNTGLYKQITQYVTESTDFVKLVNNSFLQSVNDVMVVGLHTCGDLASNSLKIYTNNEDIKAIFNVSCCYHLMTELSGCKNDNNQWGFPLSEYLNNMGFELGRSARMLSAQSVDRIFHNKQTPNKILFYRAVLQVVLEKYNVDILNKNVGKAKKEYTNFSDYAFDALKKLQVDVDTTKEELDSIYSSCAEKEYQFYVFTVIRSMLAPVIESVILLDRLLYLHEKGLKHSYLVHLFNPVISPRCYGIISMKL